MKINSTPNYFFEALAYYERRANGKTLSNARSSLNKTGEPAQMAHAVELSPLIEMENDLNKELVYPDEQIEFFFKDFENDGKISGDNRAMLLFKSFIWSEKPLNMLIDDMLTLSDVEFANAVMYGINGGGEIMLTDKPETLEECFEQINASDRSDEVKWYICQTLMLRKKHLAALRPMLADAVAALEAHYSMYAPLIDSFVDEYTKAPMLTGKIISKLGGRLELSQNCTASVHPLLFVPVGYYIFGNADEDNMLTDAHILIGVLSSSYYASNMPVLDASIIPALSVLCDKTRFKLLQRIASEPAYGQQLAEEFGMTTPNIYHHMGKLVQEKFASIRIDRNRNYYSINKNYINQLLDELKWVFRC